MIYYWIKRYFHPIRSVRMRNELRKIKNRKPVSTFKIVLFLLCAVLLAITGRDIWGAVANGEPLEVGGLVDIFNLMLTAFLAQQIGIMEDTEMMEVSQFLYGENREKRKNVDSVGCTKLIRFLRDHPDLINNAYERADAKVDPDVEFTVDQMKELVFHYEYLGQLTYYGKIHFSLLFDTITFPNDIWNAATEEIEGSGKRSFLKCIREGEGKPDYWTGFEFLYRSYEVMRKKDSLDSLCSGPIVIPSVKENEAEFPGFTMPETPAKRQGKKAAKKEKRKAEAARKAAEQLGVNQSAEKSAEEPKSRRDVIKNACKDYRDAIKNWYDCYKRMPR